MTIKERLEQNIKKAMLAGEKDLVTTLRGLKSSILYAEVAEGMRDQGLADEKVVSLFQKEAKKRQESADLYRQGGYEDKAVTEESEKTVISSYIPKEMTEEEVKQLVQSEAKRMGEVTQQQMGQLIGAVKLASKGTADGALIARYVREYIAS